MRGILHQYVEKKEFNKNSACQVIKWKFGKIVGNIKKLCNPYFYDACHAGDI